MINKRNKKNLNRDKIGKNRKKSNFFSEKRFKKKNWKEIKVVSTNIFKNKDKDKDKKFNYNPPAKQTINKKASENKNKKDLKSKISERNDINRKKVLKNHLIQYKLNILEKKICPKCKKKIEEMQSSIKDHKKDQYYHFNCVLNEIKKDNTIESKQRIVYLGSGAFGIIEDLEAETNSKKFIIKKKIQYIEND